MRVEHIRNGVGLARCGERTPPPLVAHFPPSRRPRGGLRTLRRQLGQDGCLRPLLRCHQQHVYVARAGVHTRVRPFQIRCLVHVLKEHRVRRPRDGAAHIVRVVVRHHKLARPAALFAHPKHRGGRRNDSFHERFPCIGEGHLCAPVRASLETQEHTHPALGVHLRRDHLPPATTLTSVAFLLLVLLVIDCFCYLQISSCVFVGFPQHKRHHDTVVRLSTQAKMRHGIECGGDSSPHVTLSRHTGHDLYLTAIHHIYS